VADSDVGWAHAAAIHDMLDTAVGYGVYLGRPDIPDPELVWPYLIVWPPPAGRPTIALAGYGGESTTTTQVTAAGRNVRETITALDRAAVALHRRRPVIVGRRCGLITQLADVPGPPSPDRDDQTGTPDYNVYTTFAQFSFYSAPLTGGGS